MSFWRYEFHLRVLKVSLNSSSPRGHVISSISMAPVVTSYYQGLTVARYCCMLIFLSFSFLSLLLVPSLALRGFSPSTLCFSLS